VAIAVNDTLPVISYSGSPYSFTQGSAISSQTPTNTGGAIVSCSSSPSLPAGLSLSAACVITGTPTVAQTATNYVVSGTNTAGAASTNISIAVISVPAISYPNSPYTFTKGTAISTITPTNTGSAATTCSGGTMPTGLTMNSDCSITGTPTAIQSQATYTVTNSNSAGSGTAATLKITVVDVAPTLTYSTTNFTYNKGTAITTVTPTVGGGSVTSCTSSPSLPAGLSIANTTCVITGTPTASSASQTYTITASNTGGSATQSLTIQVNDTVPALTYSSSPFSVTVNSAISGGTPTNTGGTPTSCSASPTLPAGLSLSNACAITGTPTVAQTATNYAINATSTGGTSTANISIAVIAVPTITYPSSPYTFTKGTAISTVTPTNTGSAATTCSGGTMPTGLTMNSDCSITGTPTVVQTQTTYTVTNSNSAGSGTAATLQITVVDVAPTLTYSTTNFTYSKGTAITTVTPTVGGGGITSCTSSPSLPAGLSISNTTCVITGTPTAYVASQNYTITASNTGGSATASLTIQVNDAIPALTYASSPFTITVNSAISGGTPTNTGGTPTSCTSTPTLPAGLSLSNACAITGTPTVAQTATNYEIDATNSGGTGTKNISIAVVAVPAITYPSSPYTLTKGVAISTITPNNTGSAATTCSGGTMPAGLTMAANCSITGTPTTIQTQTTYTVTNSNSAGSGTAATLKITVSDAAPAFTYPTSTYTFTKGTAITAISATSTGGAITGCTSSPALPAGL
jgi:hypothetical protein